MGHGNRIHRWLKKHKYPDGFQVLCFNCNVGKYLNKGTCPHKLLIDKKCAILNKRA